MFRIEIRMMWEHEAEAGVGGGGRTSTARVRSEQEREVCWKGTGLGQGCAPKSSRLSPVQP